MSDLTMRRFYLKEYLHLTTTTDFCCCFEYCNPTICQFGIANMNSNHMTASNPFKRFVTIVEPSKVHWVRTDSEF
jgi:hypothetical protein